MRILSIDQGTKTGWAAWYDNHTESGVEDFSVRSGESAGMKFIKFNAWLKKISEMVQPELVVFEQPHQRGGPATRIGVGLSTRIEEQAARCGVEYKMVHSGTLKKFATGKGNASKEEMILKAKELYIGLVVIDDNHADALLMLVWARETLDPQAGNFRG